MEHSIESDDTVALLHNLLPGSTTEASLDEHIKGLDALVQGFDRVSGSGSGSGSETDVFKEQRTLLEEHSEILPGSGSSPSSPSTDTATAEDRFLAYKAVAPAKSEPKKRVWELCDDCKKREATDKFVQKVKDVAENDKTYMDFINLVSSFGKHRDIDRVNDEAFEVFKRQPDLYVEFTDFLVDAIQARKRERVKSRLASEEVPAKKLKRTAEEKAPVVYEEDDVCTDLVLAPPVCRIRA